MKYRCSVQGCRAPGCFHCTVTLEDGTDVNLFYCDNEEHIMDVSFTFRNQAVNTNSIEEIKKIKGFRLQSNRKTTTQKIERQVKQIANTDWKWIEDSDYWMNAEGETIRISKLEDKELEDAVVAIRRTNIKKVTKRIQWIKELEEVCASVTMFEYPEEALRVEDIEDAYAKLEEFYEVLTERNMLP